MSIVRWAAAAVVTLMSLMNIGVVLGDPKPAMWLLVFGVVVGLLGLVAAFGLARGSTWGRAAGLGVGAVNVVGAVVGLATGLEGGAIGLAVSLVIVALSFFSTPRRTLSAPATS